MSISTIEIAVVVGGLFLGYWIANSFMGAKPKKKDEPKKAPDQESSEGASWQSSRKSSQLGRGGPRNEEEPISSSWHKILEIPPSATRGDISAAYKQKISQYHPDKVALLGPELRDLAELKSKQINAAYDYAMKLRG